MSKDYYKVLGLQKNASQDDVKRSFRELAHKHHPDKGGDAEKFKEINEAYQVLGNPEKRKQYDQFGATFDGAGAGFGGAGGPFGGFDFSGFGGGAVDLGDIMSDFFGMGSRSASGRRAKKSRGADIEMDLGVSFRDSVFGAEKFIEIYKSAKCESCGGSGAEAGAKISSCAECGGSGKVSRVQNTILGSIRTASICPRCGGEGSVPEKICHACSGAGARKKSVKLKINIPAGINDGEILRVSGGGEAGAKSGAPGDLYLHINVAEDDRFAREGDNIITRAPLDFKTAALGGAIEVATLDGAMSLKIPAGTDSGQIFRLRSKGVAGRGDILVEVYITAPKKLSKKQKQILEEWDN